MRRTWAIRVVIAGSLLAAAIVIVLALRQKLDSARRDWSKNNLEQIARALNNYHEQLGAFPYGATVDSTGRTSHSWQSKILPFQGSTPWYSMIKFDRPWDDPQNVPIFRIPQSDFLNPAVTVTTDEHGFALCHYAGSAHVFGVNRGTKLADLPDGAGHTILCGEIAEDFRPWGAPGTFRDPSAMPNSGPDAFGRPTADGAFVAMCDGTVRFVSNQVDAAVLARYSRSASASASNPTFTLAWRTLRADVQMLLQIDNHGTVTAAWVSWYDDKVERPAPIFDDDLKDVAAFTELEFLSLDGSDVTDDGLRELQTLKKLRVLNAYIPKVSAEELQRFQNSLPN